MFVTRLMYLLVVPESFTLIGKLTERQISKQTLRKAACSCPQRLQREVSVLVAFQRSAQQDLGISEDIKRRQIINVQEKEGEEATKKPGTHRT